MNNATLAVGVLSLDGSVVKTPLLQMPPVRRVHQIYFNFDGRALQDHPLFARSHEAFRNMRGWTYRLWDETSIEHLCKSKYPSLWGVYRRLKYPIQRVDIAKIMVLDTFGGIYVDLDVLPKCHVGEIVGDRPYLFDWCSRRHVIANDFMYVGTAGLPGVFEYFVSNLERVNKIPVYHKRRMRYVFQTTGPDFWSRYLKATGLARHVVRIANRSFPDPNQAHRNIRLRGPKLEIVHQLSWRAQVQ